MNWAWAIGIGSGVFTITATAAADLPKEAAIHVDAQETAAASPPPETVRLAPQSREVSLPSPGDDVEPPLWYGWQTLSLDGALIAGTIAILVLADGSDRGNTLALVPAAGFVLGGPTIHLVHHEPWRALGSLGLRAGLPVIGGAMGIGVFATCPPPEGDYGSCGLGELVVGTALGIVAASLIDGGALARESAKPRGLALSISPFISADGTTRELRLRGEF